MEDETRHSETRVDICSCADTSVQSEAEYDSNTVLIKELALKHVLQHRPEIRARPAVMMRSHRCQAKHFFCPNKNITTAEEWLIHLIITDLNWFILV